MDSSEEHDGIVAKWKGKLQKAKKAQDRWRDRAEKVYKRYHNKDSNKQTNMNILFANVQVQHGALLGGLPQPEVRRRHSMGEPPAKDAALLTEEAISYQIDNNPFREPLTEALQDALISGAGVCRVNYTPKVEEVMVVAPDGLPMPQKQIVAQDIELEFFCADHFIWEPSKNWKEVSWISFDYRMTPSEIEDQWGVDLNSEGTTELPKKVTVHEVWDKSEKQIIVFTELLDEPLEVRPDALGLEGFFPVPEPMIPYCERDELLPIPEYDFYEFWAERLQKLTERYSKLIIAAKDRGFTDASIQGALTELSRQEDATLIPIDNLMAKLSSAGGSSLSDLIHHWPIDNVVRVLEQVKLEIEFCKEQTHEITGISDIVRGASQASETATAQQIKGQWANVRLARKQNMVNRYVRDIFRIMAEIIGEHFQPEVLVGMTSLNQERVMQAIPLLKDDMQRSYVVDVETDSTIAKDEQEEFRGRLEFLQQLTGYLQNLSPLAAQGQLDAGLVKEILLMIVRGTKHGRNVEEYVLNMDGTAEQLKRLQQSAQQQMQQAQQRMQQFQQAIQQRDEAIKQRDKQIQELQKKLQGFNQQELQLEAIKVQGEAERDRGEAASEAAEAELNYAKAEEIRNNIQMVRQNPWGVPQ